MRNLTRSRKRCVHKVVLTVSFDKPIGRGDAVREVRDAIHGQFYCNWDPGTSKPPYPEEFKVRGVQSGVGL